MERRPVVLVEGESDAVVVRRLLAARTGADVVEVVPMAGVTNLARHLDALGGPAPDVLVLVDAPESRFATGALRRHGVRAESPEELGWYGVFVCDRDLEEVLIRGLGVGAVLAEVRAMGEIGAFESLAQMPQWRDRHPREQLHRFAGSGSGRKRRLAARLADLLDPEHPPAPLDAVVGRALAAAGSPRG
ncbi:ATP-dependent endonuclease [Phycicoccus sp. BSK3Z-2]|uniref:ATP-dependent endonuclease n=1 Tax=Phycicoccus avicenniae TaxID=2828860 RepID=A0A941HY83_9MICO|nr:ATP-dependent endonuclease [Phycicoccus avicenniae]MBR7742673.1 ATP-dependent endonuclease [Phycicoccus avicenniae]